MWQQPFALRHFNPVYVGLGSFTADMAGAGKHLTSGMVRKLT